MSKWPTANTEKYRPRGAGWFHFVRERSRTRTAEGRWYSNVPAGTPEAGRADTFYSWFEEQVRRERTEEESGIWSGWPRVDCISLWVRETSTQPLAAFQTAAGWKAISDLYADVQRDKLPRAYGGGASTLFARDGGDFSPSLSGGGEPNLLMARVYDIKDENVKLDRVPSRDKDIAKAGRVIDETVRRLTGTRPEVPELDKAILPPPADDGRFSRTPRTLSCDGIATYFDDARTILGPLHDATLRVLQSYLAGLEGKAAPALEENQELARQVMSLADAYGAKLFCRTHTGEMKQIRLKAAKVANLKNSDSPAAKAGKFIGTATVDGVTRTVLDSVTFPLLVAARDHAQAKELFDALDKQGRPT